MSSQHQNDDHADSAADVEQPIVARLANDGEPPIADDSVDETNPLSTSDGDRRGLAETTSTQQIAQQTVRVGSPFRIDPAPIAGTTIQRRRAKPEAFYDVGPLRYTAIGAVAAATLVLGFAAVAAWWFPGGGTIIATLGCALSVFGLYSHKRLAASTCLLLHLVLFMISYTRAIGV